MTSKDLRQKYLDFFKSKGHTIIPSASLVPENDPTTLFTSSGMQPLIPYLLGQPYPSGIKRLTNSQLCFRSQDIEEVGDNRHTTFFEMLGNWSLGDYWKEEQLDWIWEFLTKHLNIPENKLHITIFDGDKKFKVIEGGKHQSLRPDVESISIWKKIGVPESHIHYYGAEKNWWSRSGSPQSMPIGEIGGPDSEIFYDFGEELKIHENSSYKDQPCHPNCDCGRFLEVGNSVFMQYKKAGNEIFEELPNKNVDFGGGLERLLAATNNEPDIFKTDLFWPIIEELQKDTSGIKYGSDERYTRNLRIITDHLKASVFLVKSGVMPSNKLQGYILRRLLRIAAAKITSTPGPFPQKLTTISKRVIDIYKDTNYFSEKDKEFIASVIEEELNRFAKTLDRGLKEFNKLSQVSGKNAFDLFQTYGFSLELTLDLANERGIQINIEEFKKEFEKHRELSRTASSGMFKGGLADSSEITTKYHTTTHLLHAALRQVLGTHVQQKGSNITAERLRFDFSHQEKLTEEELKKVEELVNQKVREALPVSFETMDKEEALNSGALGFFTEKYGDKVSVYTIGHLVGAHHDAPSVFSKEICGGPHVTNTSQIGSIKIIKEESAGAGIRRIYAILN